MSNPYIDHLEESASEHRKRLHNKWQEYIDYNHEMDNKEDPFESRVLYAILTLSQHLFGHTMRVSSNDMTVLQDKKIAEIKKAYEPDAKDKAFVTTQIISVVAYGVLNFVLSLAGLGGATATMMKTAGDLVKGVGETGAHSLSQLHQGSKQGKQNLLNYELEYSKRLQGDQDQAKRAAEEANRKHIEMMQRNEEKRHEIVTQASRSLS